LEENEANRVTGFFIFFDRRVFWLESFLFFHFPMNEEESPFPCPFLYFSFFRASFLDSGFLSRG